jgi:hypothetical protein
MNKETFGKLITDSTFSFFAWFVISNIVCWSIWMLLPQISAFREINFAPKTYLVLLAALIWLPTLIAIAAFAMRKQAYHSIGILAAIIASLAFGAFLMTVSGFHSAEKLLLIIAAPIPSNYLMFCLSMMSPPY